MAHALRLTYALIAALDAAVLAGCGATPTSTVLEAPAPVYYPAQSPTPAGGGAACTRDRPAGNPTIGTSRQGEYAGQQLPEGYHVYATEAAVTAAIQKQYNTKANWACFQEFYPGATAVFKRKGRL
jgi:hypothetical protein